MAKFISDSSVNAEIEKLLKESENQLVLISPFIQIHERLKYFLNQKLELPNLEILIVFGKNEDNVSKSLSKDDLEFLKRFPNIEIRYNKRLHAKYAGMVFRDWRTCMQPENHLSYFHRLAGQ